MHFTVGSKKYVTPPIRAGFERCLLGRLTLVAVNKIPIRKYEAFFSNSVRILPSSLKLVILAAWHPEGVLHTSYLPLYISWLCS
jgi:hypothetical protein